MNHPPHDLLTLASSIQYKLNSCMWLVATPLDSAVLENSMRFSPIPPAVLSGSQSERGTESPSQGASEKLQ